LTRVAILVVLACAFQEIGPPTPPPEFAPEWLNLIHGSYRMQYRSRWTADDVDSDLLNFMSVTMGNPDKDLFSAAASGRFQSDLDGETGSDGFSPFDSLSDSYKKATTAQLHYAYLDITNPRPGVRVRAGRQILDEIPEALPIDGGRISFEASPGFFIAGFGGLPVNYFESSTEGDFTYGGSLEVRPWARGRARLEYLHLEDENTFGLFRDDLIGISVEHAEGACLFGGRATVLESEARDILLRGSLSDAAAGLTVDVRAYYLFEQQQAHSYGLDAYVVFLVPVEPYYQLSVAASKELSEIFGLDAALTARQLESESDEADYNHEFTRWSFTARSSRWPTRDLSVSMTGDFWQTQDDDFWTAGAAVNWQIAEHVKAVVSSYYTLYSIDGLTGEERERVRALTLALRWKATDTLFADVRFTAEENDIDTFRIFDIGGRYAF